MAADEWCGTVDELVSDTHYRHLCLEVTGLDEYCKTLKSRGVDNSRQSWITDPDGNLIELMEYGPSSMQLTRR